MNNRQILDISLASWVRLAAIVALSYAIFQVREFILVVITAVVIASAIEPAARWAKSKRIPRLPIILLVYIVTALILAGLFYFLLLPLIGEISSFIRTLSIYSNSASQGGVLSDIFKDQNLFGGLDTPTVLRGLRTHLNNITTFLSQGVFSSISTVFGGVLNFLLILVLSFYLVVQEDGISKFLKMISPLKYEGYVIGLWKRSQTKIGLWMQGQLISSAIVMMMVYIALLIVGIPHALLLSFAAGVFELIPLFGATLAAVPALFIAYVDGGMSAMLIVAAIYVVIQQVEGHVIYPLVVKKVVGVPPMVSILALVIGGTLAGFLGVVISVPVAAAIMEWISDFEERKIAQGASHDS